MTTIRSKYLGGLRTEAVHLKSGKRIITDAPLDNNGKGEAFSPTDLVCAAYGSCMMTIMGIYADAQNIKLENLSMYITKTMSTSPRKISSINIAFSWPKTDGSQEQLKVMKEKALNCPVALSVRDELEIKIEFDF